MREIRQNLEVAKLIDEATDSLVTVVEKLDAAVTAYNVEGLTERETETATAIDAVKNMMAKMGVSLSLLVLLLSIPNKTEEEQG